MKAHLSIDRARFGASFTERLLVSLLRSAGVDVVDDMAAADVLLVSMCDPGEVKLLKRAREAAGSRPVIMGGFEGYCATPYLAWADAVVTGEGFGFVEALGRGLDEALTLPNVMTATRRVVTPDYSIPWARVPICLTSERKAYWLAGRGCHRSCRYCLTSWAQPRTSAPDRLVSRVREACEEKGLKLSIVDNSSRSATGEGRTRSMSVTAADYARHPERFSTGMVRIGIEGWTEEERRAYGKPIGDETIRFLFDETARRGQQMELFFIVGRAGWSMDAVRDFVDRCIPLSTKYSPRSFVKLTYFDPCPHTPMRCDPVASVFCDSKEVWRIMSSRNRRLRVFGTRSLARTAWRSALHRSTPEQAAALGPEPGDTNTAASLSRYMLALARKGLDHLCGAIDFDPCDDVKVSRVARAR